MSSLHTALERRATSGTEARSRTTAGQLLRSFRPAM
jgi:hypothetical protein